MSSSVLFVSSCIGTPSLSAEGVCCNNKWERSVHCTRSGTLVRYVGG
jgi:hypothetical protein